MEKKEIGWDDVLLEMRKWPEAKDAKLGPCSTMAAPVRIPQPASSSSGAPAAQPPGYAASATTAADPCDEATMLAWSLQQLLQHNLSRKPFEGEVEEAQTHSAMNCMREGIVDSDHAALGGHMEKWEAAVKAAKAIMTAAGKTAQDVTAYLKNIRAEELREQKRQEAAKYSQELEASKQDAVRKANEIKRKQSKVEPLDTIYQVDVRKAGCANVPKFDTRPPNSQYNAPFLVQGEITELALGSEVLQTALVDFAKVWPHPRSYQRVWARACT